MSPGRVGHQRAGLLATVTDRFADLDDQQRQWRQLSAELWLYAQRHLILAGFQTQGGAAPSQGQGELGSW
jgi:hypothetical protein